MYVIDMCVSVHIYIGLVCRLRQYEKQEGARAVVHTRPRLGCGTPVPTSQGHGPGLFSCFFGNAGMDPKSSPHT